MTDQTEQLPEWTLMRGAPKNFAEAMTMIMECENQRYEDNENARNIISELRETKNEELKREIEELKERNVELEGFNDKLDEENVAMEGFNDEMHDCNEKRYEEIDQLKSKIANLEQNEIVREAYISELKAEIASLK